MNETLMAVYIGILCAEMVGAVKDLIDLTYRNIMEDRRRREEARRERRRQRRLQKKQEEAENAQEQ